MEEVKRWIFIVFFVGLLVHLFRSVSMTLVIFQAEKFNTYSKWVNVVLIWMIPFYWIAKVKRDIRKKQEMETNYLIEDLGLPFLDELLD